MKYIACFVSRRWSLVYCRTLCSGRLITCSFWLFVVNPGRSPYDLADSTRQISFNISVLNRLLYQGKSVPI